ncbi:DUF2480 family protein [Urechidicola sp. KH5]
MDEIRNRVAESKLVTIDLEDYYPQGQRLILDIKQWLFEGLILREQEFRSLLKEHNWSQYKNAYVAISCSSDAIIPSWAYLLIATYLAPAANKIVVGDLMQLETLIFEDVIAKLNSEKFEGKSVIIKGCSNKPIPDTAYTSIVSKLLPIAKSVMFGEACSTVPLFKSNK